MGVFSELKPVNHARKNPFDLSCYSSYNTKCGMILPLKFWPTLPNSEYELDLKALMRTQPLSTAAFAGFSINYDVVWTPNNDHYSSFNQFIAQRLNKQHVTQPDIRHIPTFEIHKFVKILLSLCVIDALRAEVSKETLEALMDSNGYQMSIPTSYMIVAEHSPEESMSLSCLRTLDLLGYGNYLPLLKGMVSAWKDMLDGLTYTVAADKNLPYFVRTLAYLDLTVSTTMPDLSGFVYESNVLDDWAVMYNKIFGATDILSLHGCYINKVIPSSENYHTLWPILCYNKAWWQFYRNEYYDIDYQIYVVTGSQLSPSGAYEYVKLFNLDDITDTLSVSMAQDGPSEDTFRLFMMFAVKPHQYKKDLFTGLLPSTQYGSVSVASTDEEFHKLIGGKVVNINNVPNSPGSVDKRQVYGLISEDSVKSSFLTTTKTESNFAGGFSQWKFDPALTISVLELRKADSLQRFRERMLRAGNKTKDIFKAHGWEEPMSEGAFDVQFFGTFDGRLDLNVVASTTDTEQVNLGQLAANGVGVIGGNKIRFKSHDFGTLLICAYLTKDAIYDAYGVHKSHSLIEAFDYPYPELQNVSLAPITQDQIMDYGFKSDDYNRAAAVNGYLPQNMAYKTAIDEVHGEFFAVNPFEGQPIVDGKNVLPVGIFSNMVTPRLDIANSRALSFFYIQPSCADNIFVQNADSLQSSDQFFCNVHFDLKAVQPLDVIGLPI